MKSKSKKKSSKKKGNLLQKYNSKSAKKSAKFTAMKTGVDVLGTAAVGPAIGAGLGIFAPVAGLIMIAAGHFLGDQSGLLRLTGAATIGYGIAKARSNRMRTGQNFVDSAKDRYIELKDDWMNATYLDKLIKSDNQSETPVEGIGAIDLSELDHFERLNQQAAIDFETERVLEEDNDDLEGMESDFEIIEELDLSTI